MANAAAQRGDQLQHAGHLEKWRPHRHYRRRFARVEGLQRARWEGSLDVARLAFLQRADACLHGGYDFLRGLVTGKIGFSMAELVGHARKIRPWRIRFSR